MSMDQFLPAFFEELEKLGVSKRGAPFMQSRAGRRPIRAQKLLEKDNAFSRPPTEGGGGDDSASGYEHEYGGGMAEKVGSVVPPEKRKETLQTKAIRSAVGARPWVSSAVKGAIPAAVAANFLLPASSQQGLKYKSRIVAGIGALGAGAGVADRALKIWAAKNPRAEVAKQLKKQGSADTMRKIAAMAADLRMKGLGGVKRPPFATEDSKQFAFNQLKNSKSPGYFTTQTQQKHLKRPGPSIEQVAPTPGG
jgi:hypothetical protein